MSPNQVYNILGNVRIKCREALNKKSAEEIRKISPVNRGKLKGKLISEVLNFSLIK